MTENKKSDLLYPHDAQMPVGKATVSALQQVIAMFVGCITPILIFASVVNIEPELRSYMISMALLSSGIGTFLQAKRFGPLGSGLLSINGTSFAFVDLLLRAGNEGGLPLACGMALAAVPFQFVLGFFLPWLRKIFSPLVAGVVVLLIGINLIPVSGYYLSKGVQSETPWTLTALVAGAVLLTLIITQTLNRPLLRLSGPLIAIAIGYALAYFCGMLEFPPLPDQGWLVIPQPFAQGLAFKWELLIPFMVIYLASSLEAIGDLSAAASLSGLETKGESFWKRLRGGIFSDALTSTIACCLNVFPTATFSQNNGVIQLTGVGSRQVGYYVAGILVVTGLFPLTGYFFGVMPNPVLGGITLVLFGLIASAGIRMINEVKLGHQEMLLVAVSLGLAFAISSQKELIATLPEILQAICSSSVATGGLVAIVMNGYLQLSSKKESL